MEIQTLITQFESEANPQQAKAMSAYMKDQFPFLGIKSPERRSISKAHINAWLSEGRLAEHIVFDLWAMPEREYQYVALDYLFKTKRYWEPGHISLFEFLIKSKPWWDTVDLIASNLVGGLMKSYDELLPLLDKWNRSEELWLIRSSIIYQLKYKDAVDWARLQRYILAHVGSKEFFIQKASGWALRQYSKYSPEEVSAFIDTYALPPLTVREGRKYLDM